ncbi:HD domain-containing protein [Aquisphaera insulae]|uniref:HD domain-containing protein n=1 Tax=Aquisphaera insulae TaxID=2712864 RepID=UPI0013EB9C59|nr:HD domain-containing protein [Aquisphaera insulae]
MQKAHRLYEIRCPVHGFITITDWEREIINLPAFQRLRRIRQLAWTDQVYPGAMHTRFEHSLGVLHVASRLFDAIATKSRDLLINEHSYKDAGLERDRTLVRLAALLHDVGHAPFSHAAEELFPLEVPAESIGDSGDSTERECRRFRHEDYSAAIIRQSLRDAIEDHPLNQNHGLKADDVANLLEGNVRAGRALLWKEVIAGQLDADRMDYLIRDSLHAGVDYGKFDWRRLVNSVLLVPGGEDRAFRLGVEEGGFHAAEGLVLARYFMFTQVYFHKTRVAYNIHLRQALAELLPGGVFSRPTQDELEDYLKWDDWRVLGMLREGGGGDHGRRLCDRDHYREIYHSPEFPAPEDRTSLDQVRTRLGSLLQAEETSETSAYKLGKSDIPVKGENPSVEIKPLSEYSSVVRALRPLAVSRLYCRKEDVEAARDQLAGLEGSKS